MQTQTKTINYTLDYKRGLNVLLKDIRYGNINKEIAKERFEIVLGLALFPNEKEEVKNSFSEVMIARFGKEWET